MPEAALALLIGAHGPEEVHAAERGPVGVAGSGSSWKRVGENVGLRGREPALGAVGSGLEGAQKSGMICACQTRDDRAGCGMRIAFRDSVRVRRCGGSSATRTSESCPSPVGHRNGLSDAWPGAARLVRPQAPSGPRPGLQRPAHLPGDRGPARGVLLLPKIGPKSPTRFHEDPEDLYCRRSYRRCEPPGSTRNPNESELFRRLSSPLNRRQRDAAGCCHVLAAPSA